MENKLSNEEWEELLGQTQLANSKPLRDTIIEYLRYWKWFVLSAICCLVVATLVVMTSKKVFQTTAAVVIDEDKNKSGGSSSGLNLSLDDLGLLASTSNIDNEITVFTSPDLMRTVVDTLNLTSHYYERDRLRYRELYASSPLKVVYSRRLESFSGSFELTVVKENGKIGVEGKYQGKEDLVIDINQTFTKLPAKLILPSGYGYLEFSATSIPMEEDNEYTIVVSNPDAEALTLQNQLKVTQTTKNSTALQFALSVNNPSKGADVLKQLIRQYNIQNNLVNNEISYNTALFINERLKEISKELSDVESDVVNYRQKNKIADIKTESMLSVQQNSENQQKLMDAETQLNVIDMVEKFVRNPENQYRVIPNLGVTDPSLSAIISDFNVKILTSENLLKNTGVENPARTKAIDEIQNTHNNIVNSLKNVRHSLLIARNDLQRLAGTTNAQIASLPQQEKGLMERARQQQIKENLFLFLMQKREETNISIAGISEKARMVVSPKPIDIPTAPNTKVILLAGLFLGLFIPVVVLWLMNQLRVYVSGREELARLSPVSIIGQVCRSEDPLVVHNYPQSSTSELFRALRNNLNFVFHNHLNKVAMVTSSVSGEGKTFMSMNLALSYALSGKKVLLIGGDIRRPKLKQILGLDKSSGLSDYLAQESKSWRDYVIHDVLRPKFDVLVSGTIPPNPNELLMSPNLEQLFKEVREVYDMIVIDTAPVGMVSDSFLYAPYVDAVIYVVREKVSLKDSIEFLNSIHKEKRFQNMYLVLNDCDVSSHYGYRYGYGKGYGYNNATTTKK